MPCSTDYGIVHLHPTLRCNLRCRHCYSTSSPGAKPGLSGARILPYLDYLKREHGYNVLSVSGGEPLLYPELPELLAAAHEIGYHTQLVSNGMLLGSRRAQRVLDHTDSLAVSIDGDRELHNALRDSPDAYDRTLEGLAVLRDRGANFGLIHTLTKRSWRLLPELVALAHAYGAGLLQLHTLEAAGRAVSAVDPGLYLDQGDLHRVFLLTTVIRQTETALKVQLDLIHRDHLEEHPEAVRAGATPPRSMRELSRELIITETGDVLPFAYGFDARFRVDNINELGYLEGDPVGDYFRQRGDGLHALVRHTLREVLEGTDQLINWSERLLRAAGAAQQAVVT